MKLSTTFLTLSLLMTLLGLSWNGNKAWADDEESLPNDSDVSENNQESESGERCITVPPADKTLLYSAENRYVSSLNFGVLVENPYYTLYRSSKMDEGSLKKLYTHLTKYSLPYPKTIIYMNRQGYGGYASVFQKNAIQEYEGSLEYGFEFFHPYRYDYRTYLEGKNPYQPHDDIDKKKYVNDTAVKYFGLIGDGKEDGGVDAFIRIMELVLDPNRQPVLFHCYGGRHRTGMVALMIRNIQGGEWVNGPTVTMTIGGKKYQLNPAEYEYYRHNRSFMRKENIDFVREFVAKEPIFQEWQDKYQNRLNEK